MITPRNFSLKPEAFCWMTVNPLSHVVKQPLPIARLVTVFSIPWPVDTRGSMRLQLRGVGPHTLGWGKAITSLIATILEIAMSGDVAAPFLLSALDQPLEHLAHEARATVDEAGVAL
jgi:hypothetical protein